ncbi:hypothetical protein PG984_015530 [Apiospora sp. TS-2023a]
MDVLRGREGHAEVLGEDVAADAGDDDGRRGRLGLGGRRRRPGRDAEAVDARAVVLLVRVAAIRAGVVRGPCRPHRHGPVQAGAGDAPAGGDNCGGPLGEWGRAATADGGGYGGGGFRVGGSERSCCPERGWKMILAELAFNIETYCVGGVTVTVFRAEQSARRLARSGTPVVPNSPAEHLAACEVSTSDLLIRGASMGDNWVNVAEEDNDDNDVDNEDDEVSLEVVKAELDDD